MASFTSTPTPLPPPPFVIDSTETSITFQYPPYPSAVRYTISIKSDNKDEFIDEFDKDENNIHQQEGWLVLSKSFKGLKIKKKNLLPTSTYTFRYRPSDSYDILSPPSPPTQPTKVLQPAKTIPTPTAVPGSTHGTAVVKWSEPAGKQEGHKYRLYMRTSSTPFKPVGVVAGTEVIKRGLDSSDVYHFKLG
eukprot:CAMPEP_0118653972 /NCGR_PEP_ID=MMETSP0785-20121206/12117_1 /TAXON_ID=91992 /ORGANISM="Bolidomonas pacifica, Strain CCMP 1866" /LENGTH=190 /DNA_ID=CAMNT_0006546553 /DNA_START=143 /DNA_END=711 /DNA_ORIENTATION=-